MSMRTGAQIRRAIRKQCLLEALEAAPKTASELAAEIDVPHRTVRKLVRELRDDDRIEVSGTADNPNGRGENIYALVENGKADR